MTSLKKTQSASFFPLASKIARSVILLALTIFCVAAFTGFKKESFRQSKESSVLFRNPRPFSGSFETVATTVSPPPNFQLRVRGNGTATHLGKSFFDSEVTINTTTIPFQLSGTTTFHAANGDQLFTSFTGTSTPNGNGTNTVVFNYEITGGTGRFTDASGSFTGHAIAVVGEPAGSVTYEGTISY